MAGINSPTAVIENSCKNRQKNIQISVLAIFHFCSHIKVTKHNCWEHKHNFLGSPWLKNNRKFLVCEGWLLSKFHKNVCVRMKNSSWEVIQDEIFLIFIEINPG